jgi:uncharacterized protein YdeI (YjbR/CyaY-like superfamily)
MRAMATRKTTHEQARFFRSQAAFHAWLARHHAKRSELWVGFHRRSTGRPTLTWPESVDAALCFGWIDGIRQRVDEERYAIRFTPRKSTSKWSAINLRRVQELIRAGRMRPAGLAAYDRRPRTRAAGYGHEAKSAEFPPELLRAFQSKARAWSYFQSRPPGYRKIVTNWVVTAVKDETKRSRLARLIACCAKGEPIPPLARPAKPAKSAKPMNPAKPAKS